MKQHENIKNVYGLLGVPPSASTKQVQRAFRKLAQACQPDRDPTPEATAKFQELAEAYRTLKIPGKRDEFDAKAISDFCRANLDGFRDRSEEAKPKPTPVVFRILKKSSGSQQR